MPTRFTDPDQMRAMAGRFDVHAQTEDEARKMWASSQNIAGASWSGIAQASYDTMSPFGVGADERDRRASGDGTDSQRP